MARGSKPIKSDKPAYRIELPESADWSLHDLYIFPHAYEQCYAFVYCLDTDLPARDRDAIDYAFNKYPWKGGYSYVNIYSVLQRQIPVRDRPVIKSLHKASPGWIDLILHHDVAVELAKSVAALSGAVTAAAAAYKKTYTLLQSIKAEREKARLQVLQLNQHQIKAVRGCCEELAKAMGFKSLSDLHRRTGDPEVSLKLLSAHYRRMKVLQEYAAKDKALLPYEDTDA